MLLIFSVGSGSVLFRSVFIDLKYFNSESFALVAFHAFGHYIGDEGIWNLSTATPYFLLFKDDNAWQNVPV